MLGCFIICNAASMSGGCSAAASLPVHHGRPAPDHVIRFLLPAASGTFLLELLALFSVVHCASWHCPKKLLNIIAYGITFVGFDITVRSAVHQQNEFPQFCGLWKLCADSAGWYGLKPRRIIWCLLLNTCCVQKYMPYMACALRRL
jgi:hypothetical protein